MSERLSPAELIEAHERRLADQQPIPDDIPLIRLADMVVRGKVKLSPPQQRMLIEMLPYIAPKLSAIGFVRDAETFASRLEKAIERSNGARLIEAKVLSDDES